MRTQPAAASAAAVNAVMDEYIRDRAVGDGELDRLYDHANASACWLPKFCDSTFLLTSRFHMCNLANIFRYRRGLYDLRLTYTAGKQKANIANI